MSSRGRRGPSALPPIRKSLGQHFLSDRRILTRIVDALDPRPNETVLEIGPGRGALTALLLERCGRLIAIEYDRALAAMLREHYGADPRIQIVEGDVLEVDFGALAGGRYSLIGNVPYYITTPILFQSLQPPRADRAVFLVQREVAKRMSAAAGDDDYGALSVNLQSVANAETVFRVPAGAFNPPPKVDSAVVRIEPKTTPTVKPEEERPFREFVQAAFGFRRKQMRRVLREIQPMTAEAADALLGEVGIATDARPETLTAERFAALFRVLPRTS
jgi:16S rRNA (adenine1518-N6/adenine1519-N6)-dimethyltransferase